MTFLLIKVLERLGGEVEYSKDNPVDITLLFLANPTGFVKMS